MKKSPLIITKNKDIVDYCKEHSITISNFNEPVVISKNIVNCNYLFFGCYSFNQPIIIPNNVTNCENMFYNCFSFNQPIIIPNSVKKCDAMFFNCTSFNQPIIIPNSIESCDEIFGCCNSLQYLYYNNYIEEILKYRRLIYRGCHKLTYLNMPDNLIIKYYNDLLLYAQLHDNVELISYLLDFKNNHKHDFIDEDISL